MARMLSTVDNPYDPRTSWDEWFALTLPTATVPVASWPGCAHQAIR